MECFFKYAFEGLPYIVADAKGNFYQLPHCSNNRTKTFRPLKKVLNNNITPGYRINRRFISLYQLRKINYINRIVYNDSTNITCPF